MTFRERAPWWGGDLQTLRNQFARRRAPLSIHAAAVEFETSDGSGDRLTGTLEQPLAPSPRAPLVVLIHGLTGCQESAYVRESARFFLARGLCVLRLNLRGAGSSRRVAGGYYHAGCAADLRDVFRGLREVDRPNGVFAIGYSLGGNILLNLLGQPGLHPNLVGAATVSAPIRPLEASQRMMAPRNAIYHRWLLQRMKRDVLSSASLTEHERAAIRRAQTVFEFDEFCVAPRNGFHGALDYYERTAGARFVAAIGVPTLMLHACNDPWIPADPYFALLDRTPPTVEIAIAKSGGHVGFHERGHAETWHDRTIAAFMCRRLAHFTDAHFA